MPLVLNASGLWMSDIKRNVLVFTLSIGKVGVLREFSMIMTLFTFTKVLSSYL